jgi:hypothetical protein
VCTLPIPIYHFTHAENLPSIIAAGAVVCDRFCKASDLTQRNVAYSGLKQRRSNTIVEVPPGGMLCDYVPFYFGTRSPMLYTYKKGNVTGRPENQDYIVYLASTVEHIVANKVPSVFTDGHPVVEPKAFYNNLADINQVDLALMTKRDWFDTNADPDRKRRRQAEFLVYQRFAWDLVLEVGARTPAMQQWVYQVMGNTPYKPPCIVRPAWYYQDWE